MELTFLVFRQEILLYCEAIGIRSESKEQFTSTNELKSIKISMDVQQVYKRKMQCMRNNQTS